MFRKIVDVLKEVFWIKPSRRKPKSTRRKPVPAKRKPVKKVPRPPVRPKPKLSVPKKQAQQAAKSVAKTIDPSLTQAGVITHYFDRIKVCVVKLTQGTVLIGDKLTIIGPKTKFVQKVWSLQIESEDVKVAKKGQLIGLKVDKLVAVGDKVYK
jgi:hypothetical protein